MISVPFYLSFTDEYYPVELALKKCALCGGDIAFGDRGVGYMFCDVKCAKKYWDIEVKELK